MLSVLDLNPCEAKHDSSSCLSLHIALSTHSHPFSPVHLSHLGMQVLHPSAPLTSRKNISSFIPYRKLWLLSSSTAKPNSPSPLLPYFHLAMPSWGWWDAGHEMKQRISRKGTLNLPVVRTSRICRQLDLCGPRAGLLPQFSHSCVLKMARSLGKLVLMAFDAFLRHLPWPILYINTE